MGEENLSLRKRYGLTQQAAAKIFGNGRISFSRCENEATYPDQSTTLLLRLPIDMPDVIKALANIAEVDLPLWLERSSDMQSPSSPRDQAVEDMAEVAETKGDQVVDQIQLSCELENCRGG